MPSWQGKSKGTRLGYGIFVAILKNWGVLPAYFLLRFVALYYLLFSYSASRIILHYFKRLGYPYFRRLTLLYRNYCLLGQTIIDRIVLTSGLSNRFTFNFDGEENLRQMVKEKKGGLLLSAHIGNWEIAGYLLKRLDTRVHIVMFDNEHRNIKKYLDSVTGEKTANIIVIRDDLSHIYQISEAFRNNELVCMHADRFLEGNKTMESDLLGSPALFPAGPFILATTFKVPLSYVFALKESHFHYHFFASPVRHPGRKEKEAEMQELLNEFTREMGEKMKNYPEQWFNYYEFWKKES